MTKDEIITEVCRQIEEEFKKLSDKIKADEKLNFGKPTVDQVSEPFDKFLGFLLEHFHDCPNSEEMREAYKVKAPTMFEGFSTVVYSAVPIIAVKTVIGSLRLSVNTTKLKNWNSFIRRFSGSMSE